MNIKTKKQNPDGIVRLETSGEIREIIFKEDFLKSNEASIHICFKGKSSSGIIELSPEEIKKIYRDTMPRLNILKRPKIIKFKR